MATSRIRSDKNIKTISEIMQDNPEESEPESMEKPRSEHPTILLIEPFYGGSHKQLIDILRKHIPDNRLITLTPKKWHWRARCSSLIISSMIPDITTERILFCSSVLSLAELLGLKPELHALKKIVYFHENQLMYPIRHIKQRDVQFAYNQITSCLAADVVLFNSCYNKDSFLDNIKSFVKMLPDYKPKDLRAKIEPKCVVLYFLLDLSNCVVNNGIKSNTVLRLVWPHRWEFDKNPQAFIRVLLRLKNDGLNFRVSIIGQTFTDLPDLFAEAKVCLTKEIVHFGYVESKTEYYEILNSCHVAVSTAKQEFFGVSMLEAGFCGCFPLVPDRLVYPEIYPKNCLYRDEELYERLKMYCLAPELAVEHRNGLELDFSRFSVDNLLPKYLDVLKVE